MVVNEGAATVVPAHTPSPQEQLMQLVGTLSDEECGYLLRLYGRTVAGNRYWEDDVAVFYNEYVKARYFTVVKDPAKVLPPLPDSGSGIYAPITVEKSYPEAPALPLPVPQPLTAGLSDVIIRRRSRRELSGAALSLLQLETLLEHGAGVTGTTSAYGFTNMPLRTFPSTGGLQSPEVYVYARAVNGAPVGLYHYHAMRRVLEAIKPGDHMGKVRAALLSMPYVERASAIVFITGCYDRLRWKYGARAYRYMCMDVGALAENLLLAGEAMGLGLCPVAAFIEDLTEHLLGVDGTNEMAMLAMTVGVRAA